MSANNLQYFQYFFVFLASFLTAYLLTPLVRAAAVRLRIVDHPDDRRKHAVATARCGGIAVFVGFHAACAVIFFLLPVQAGALIALRWWLFFLAASLLLLLTGLLDDCRGVSPLTKLAGQLAAGVVLWLSGTGVEHFLGWNLPWFLDLLLTLMWLLIVTNAFNLIDGIDGLATGLAIIAACGIAGALLFRGYTYDVMVPVALIGAGVAFLRFNFHPASIFLGDSGSMFLGFALAAIALKTGSKGAATASIGVPLMAVGVPVFDVMLAVWRRSARKLSPERNGNGANGSSIATADSEHLHHRLVNRGLSQRQVAGLLYAINAVLIVVALASLAYRSLAAGLYLLAFAGGSYVVVRHLATVELWDSARGILSGLSRPSRKTTAVISYPFVDALILCACWATVRYVLQARGVDSPAWQGGYLSSLSVWAAIPFFLLVVSGTYRRVWSRARAMDFVVLVWTVLSGIIVALGIESLITGNCDWRMMAVATLYFAVCALLLVGIRAFFICVRDAIALFGWNAGKDNAGKDRKLLVYGGGMTCVYFLKSRHSSSANSVPEGKVCGIIDDDPNLRGRLVCSCPVLGGLADLEKISAKDKPDEIVVTARLAPGRKGQLLEWARRECVTVSEWVMESRLLQGANCGERGDPA